MCGVFFTPDLVGVLQPLRQQEAVGGDAETGVMMKAAPAPPFIMSKSKFLLQFLIVALNPPAQFCHRDKLA